MLDEITIQPSTDFDYIESVFVNPLIYQQMRDDSCPESPSDLRVSTMRQIPGFFLEVLVNGVRSGVFWLRKLDAGLEAHTALMPNCRGRSAIRATKQALKWCFDNTETPFVMSYAWSDSPAVSWFCRAVGMTPYDTQKWPNTRNGQPVDITYFKIQRA